VKTNRHHEDEEMKRADSRSKLRSDLCCSRFRYGGIAKIHDPLQAGATGI